MLIFGSLTNVFIGLALTFLMVSLLVSTLTEALASILGWRSKTFIEGLKSILNDPELNGLAQAVLNHAAVNPRGTGNDLSVSIDRGEAPSYVDPKQFANALLDVIQNPPASRPPVHLDVHAAIAGIHDGQLRSFFIGLYDRTGGDLKKIHDEVTEWFETAMERVSGVYKRNIQTVSFCMAFAISFMFNVDAVHIAEMIWEHPEIIASVQMPTNPETGRYSDYYSSRSASAQIQISRLQLVRQEGKEGLVGWSFIEKHGEGDENTEKFAQQTILKVTGWFVTALAAIFGAPFWFDILQRFIRLRGTGNPPRKLRRKK